MKYSAIITIDKLMAESISELEENGFQINSSKDIQYGTNFEISFRDINFILSIYYTATKGFKFVFLKCNNEKIERTVKQILIKHVKNKNELSIPFKNYIGMDEAGKGDYFGPLVLAGFIYDKSLQNQLMEIGVSDSKLLSDEKIKELTRIILTKYPERVKIKEIKPPEYNRRISDLKKSMGNLNTLLSEGYSDILLKVQNNSFIDGAVIDKFAGEDFILKIIHRSLPDIKTILSENAERDPAVAAASIIARGIFIRNIEEISCKFGVTIPLGSGNDVKKFASYFVSRFGEDNLALISKTHFKITQSVTGMLF